MTINDHLGPDMTRDPAAIKVKLNIVLNEDNGRELLPDQFL